MMEKSINNWKVWIESKTEIYILKSLTMLKWAYSAFSCLHQCYSWGGAMGHRPIQQQKVAHWQLKLLY